MRGPSPSSPPFGPRSHPSLPGSAAIPPLPCLPTTHDQVLPCSHEAMSSLNHQLGSASVCYPASRLLSTGQPYIDCSVRQISQLCFSYPAPSDDWLLKSFTSWMTRLP